MESLVLLSLSWLSVKDKKLSIYGLSNMRFGPRDGLFLVFSYSYKLDLRIAELKLVLCSNPKVLFERSRLFSPNALLTEDDFKIRLDMFLTISSSSSFSIISSAPCLCLPFTNWVLLSYLSSSFLIYYTCFFWFLLPSFISLSVVSWSPVII